MKLFGTMQVNQAGHLEVGGCDIEELVNQFGTPLYVMDEEHIRKQCQFIKAHFGSREVNTEIIYASKAFINIAMCQLINEEGLSLDVVSGGELYTALIANFPVNRIYFHGNNKTIDELKLAVNHNIGRIIIDNFDEMEQLTEVCKTAKKQICVLLRVNPGIEAHTHEYISTTKNDSKFGESIFSENTIKLIKAIKDNAFLQFMGLHSHIGSQIFEEESFYKQITIMMSFIKTIKERLGMDTLELNLGGGFGIYYVDGDLPIDLPQFLPRVIERVKNDADGLNIKIPKLMIEPGRAIVGNAGTTLYSVGSTKTTYGKKNYVFVDGGMSDNIRPALYEAKYEAALANRMHEKGEEIYTVAGKCCESGDILVKDVTLPTPKKGDILAVMTTGAYNYSMSSNYNRLPRPAVIFVKDKKVKLVVKRETYEDIIRNDIIN